MKLATHFNSQQDREISAWIEGPYGGVGRPIERLYDTIILVAGGTGITACLPWLEYVTSKAEDIRCQRLVLIWVMKEQDHVKWAEPTLEMVATRTRSPVLVQTRFFVTSSTALILPAQIAEGKFEGEDLAEEKMGVGDGAAYSSDPRPGGRSMQLTPGRPFIGALVEEEISEGKVFVFGCGPESLRSDLANACAMAQKRVMKGKVQEVTLHLEAFGW
ncbi:hypothetical protein IFR05_003385 [Cadophora sp. M221]|nr:hypothetical protein IFR05_003385 [Cadophora sp. M221]